MSSKKRLLKILKGIKKQYIKRNYCCVCGWKINKWNPFKSKVWIENTATGDRMHIGCYEAYKKNGTGRN